MWDLLGLAPTRDVKTIRRAYAARLKAIPDHDPASFQRLRQAYEGALAEAAGDYMPRKDPPPAALPILSPVLPHPAATGNPFALPEFWHGWIYELGVGPGHLHGMWRRTTIAGYGSASPPWEEGLDLYALVEHDWVEWTWGGMTALRPEERRALIHLHTEDVTELREFDLETCRFIEGGFRITARQPILDWLDPYTLVIAQNWGPDSLTESGHPFVVKLLGRGQALAEAWEVFRGAPTDGALRIKTHINDASGEGVVLMTRQPEAGRLEHWALTPAGPLRLPLPVQAGHPSLVMDQLVFVLWQSWTPLGAACEIPEGSLIGVDFSALLCGQVRHLSVLFTPDGDATLVHFGVSLDTVIGVIRDAVRCIALIWTRHGDRWSARPLATPGSPWIALHHVDIVTPHALLWATDDQGIATIQVAELSSAAIVLTLPLPSGCTIAATLDAVGAHPRDGFAHQVVLIQAQTLFENLLGPERARIGGAIAALILALGNRKEAEIRTARVTLTALLSEYDS